LKLEDVDIVDNVVKRDQVGDNVDMMDMKMFRINKWRDVKSQAVQSRYSFETDHQL